VPLFPNYSTPLKVIEEVVTEGDEYAEYFEVVSPTCGFTVYFSAVDTDASYLFSESNNKLYVFVGNPITNVIEFPDEDNWHVDCDAYDHWIVE